MLLNGANGTYTEKLNGLMQYDLVCIGNKGTKQYYYKIGAIRPQTYTGLQLIPIDLPALETAVNALRPLGQPLSIGEEIKYAIWDVQYAKEENAQLKWQQLVEDLVAAFFPCADIGGLIEGWPASDLPIVGSNNRSGKLVR
jgi:hypothetical protein